MDKVDLEFVVLQNEIIQIHHNQGIFLNYNVQIKEL